MKKIVITAVLMALVFSAFGQSKSVDRFRNTNDPDLKLFFYKSTLKMYARLSANLTGEIKPDENGETPDLASLIEGIEKVMFFNYDPRSLDANQMDQLKSDVLDEGYESVMNARMNGANIEILMKEKRSKPVGFVVLIESEEGESIIDIEGIPDLSNLMKLSDFMSSNTESFNLLKNAFD
jgi:uncharacterized protein DUF4252